MGGPHAPQIPWLGWGELHPIGEKNHKMGMELKKTPSEPQAAGWGENCWFLGGGGAELLTPPICVGRAGLPATPAPWTS